MDFKLSMCSNCGQAAAPYNVLQQIKINEGLNQRGYSCVRVRVCVCMCVCLCFCEAKQSLNGRLN